MKKCKICGSMLSKAYEDVEDRLKMGDRTFKIFECVECGVGFTMVDKLNLDNYYPINYLNLNKKTNLLEKFYRNDQYAFDFGYLSKITKINSYLDIGAGSGDRLIYLKNVGIPKVVGLDKYKNCIDDNLEIVNREVLNYFSKNKFKVVGMFHVLEHMLDFTDILIHIKENLLEKNGYLIIQVPNYNCIERKFFGKKWFGLDCPRHVNHFSEESLRFLFKKLNLKIITLDKKNALLHPVTLVSTIFPFLDVQKSWNDRNVFIAKLRIVFWSVITILMIPLNLLLNVLKSNSMLTVVLKNEDN